MTIPRSLTFAVLALAGCLPTFAAPSATPASPARAAAPFDVVIGSTSCVDAQKLLGGRVEQDGNKVVVKAADPTSLYPGASEIHAYCFSDDKPVVLLYVVAGKGGISSESALKAYRTLAAKYKQVEGQPFRNLQDNMARFTHGDSVVIFESAHMSFNFSVTYQTAELYRRVVEDRIQRQREQAGKATRL